MSFHQPFVFPTSAAKVTVFPVRYPVVTARQASSLLDGNHPGCLAVKAGLEPATYDCKIFENQSALTN